MILYSVIYDTTYKQLFFKLHEIKAKQIIANQNFIMFWLL